MDGGHVCRSFGSSKGRSESESRSSPRIRLPFPKTEMFGFMCARLSASKCSASAGETSALLRRIGAISIRAELDDGSAAACPPVGTRQGFACKAVALLSMRSYCKAIFRVTLSNFSSFVYRKDPIFPFAQL